MDWVCQRLGSFTPFDEDNIYRPARTKPFTELAIMFAVHAATTGDTTSAHAQSAARLFQAATERADFTDWSVRFPADIVNYAELCAAVDELGGDARQLRHRLQAAVDAGALHQVERLPHRLVELRAALDWAGIAHSLPSTEDICAQTLLAEAVSASLLPDASIYAVTHVLIFASRFGLRRADLPDWLRSDSVRTLLLDLLIVTSQARNWDLLGELLLCWDCIGFPHDPVTTAGWASFLDAGHPDGAVLPRDPGGMAGAATGKAGLVTNAADAPAFKVAYHTTLVAILAGTVTLNRSRDGASHVSGSVSAHREVTVLRPSGGAARPPNTPTRESLGPIASAARSWLVSLLPRIPPRGTVGTRALCQVLVATWIADAMAPRATETSERFAAVARYVTEALTAPPGRPPIRSVKPTLRLLVALLLSSQGLQVEAFSEFFMQSVAILRRDDARLQIDQSLIDKRLILYRAGLLPEPPAAPPDRVRRLFDDFRLSASSEAIDALTLELECLTGWGTRLLDLEVVTRPLGDLLAGLTVQRLRNYDLISAARVLRLREYVVGGDAAVRRDGLYRELCMHHRAHGPFGWYGPERAGLRAEGPSLADDLDLYLPTTLECLWALAETSAGGWRLFANLPPYTLNSTEAGEP